MPRTLTKPRGYPRGISFVVEGALLLVEYSTFLPVRPGRIESYRFCSGCMTVSPCSRNRRQPLRFSPKPKEKAGIETCFFFWCGQGESNSRLILGKDSLYHLTMAAYVRQIIVFMKIECNARSMRKGRYGSAFALKHQIDLCPNRLMSSFPIFLSGNDANGAPEQFSPNKSP